MVAQPLLDVSLLVLLRLCPLLRRRHAPRSQARRAIKVHLLRPRRPADDGADRAVDEAEVRHEVQVLEQDDLGPHLELEAVDRQDAVVELLVVEQELHAGALVALEQGQHGVLPVEDAEAVVADEVVRLECLLRERQLLHLLLIPAVHLWLVVTW